MELGKCKQACLDVMQLPPGKAPDCLHGQGSPGVRKVLNGCAVVDVLASLGWQNPHQAADEPERGVTGASRLLNNEGEVESLYSRPDGDHRSGGFWDDSMLRLGLRQGDQDVQPCLKPGALLEDGVEFR